MCLFSVFFMALVFGSPMCLHAFSSFHGLLQWIKFSESLFVHLIGQEGLMLTDLSHFLRDWTALVLYQM